MKRLAKGRLTLIIGLVLLIAMVSFAGACAKPAPAPAPTPAPTPAPPKETAADFYKGKTVTILVGTSVGGGKDLNARLLAEYLPKRLGASVIVKNMPGANSLVATNYLYGLKNPDGLTISAFPRDSLYGNALTKGVEGMKYELEKFEYLGCLQPSGYTLFVTPDSPYKTVEDLQQAKKQLKWGAGGAPGDWWALGCAVTSEFLGLNARLVLGYQGTSPLTLAIKTGEVDGSALSTLSGQRMEEQGMVRALFAVNLEREKTIYPNLPALPELVKLSPTETRILEVYSLISSGTVVMTTPGTPADRVKFLRDALDAVAANKDFQGGLAKAEGVFIGYMSGEELVKEVAKVALMKDDLNNLLFPLVDKYKALK